ncbi:MAG TPA: hypothetical protein VMZ91_04350 [Candidatus Paceibacterota bacterium]|nr:hypothetical protein [Candidatus Paceibacterota bacterium]
MSRITEKDLESAVGILNRAMGFKRTYVKSRAEYKGKEFVIGGAYGGYRLELRGSRGMSDISPRGTKAEIYEYIKAMIKGADYYKNRNKK